MSEANALYLWAAAVILGFPLLTFAIGETARALGPGRPETAAWLRVVQNLLLPLGALWVILQKVAGLDANGLVMRLADTVLAAALIYVSLGIVQLVLLGNAQLAAKAPKLLIDLGRLMLVAFGVAVVISQVWGVDLGSLVAALGVGSVVLGLAMQGVVGSIVHGVMLLSGRHFAIGDTLKFGDITGKVVQIDWLAVTIEGGGERIIIPSGDLAQKSFVILGPPLNPRRVEVTVEAGFENPPEAVRSVLQRAARDIAGLSAERAPVCRVKAFLQTGVQYTVTLSLRPELSPGAARDELLSRFWYLAQREGIALGAPPPEGRAALGLAAQAATPEGRIALLRQNGAFGAADLPVAEIAARTRFCRYRPGEPLLSRGEVPTVLHALLEGEVAVTAEASGTRLGVLRLTPGDLLATRAGLRGDPSQVRAEAVGHVSVLTMRIADLLPLLSRSPSLARVIEAALDTNDEAMAKVQGTQKGLRPAA